MVQEAHGKAACFAVGGRSRWERLWVLGGSRPVEVGCLGLKGKLQTGLESPVVVPSEASRHAGWHRQWVGLEQERDKPGPSDATREVALLPAPAPLAWPSRASLASCSPGPGGGHHGGSLGISGAPRGARQRGAGMPGCAMCWEMIRKSPLGMSP